MKIVVTARSGAGEFECAPGEKILHAGLRSGLELPYECGTGTCGMCKARLVSGRVESEWPEAPGGRYLKDPADLLMCQCVAHEACALEVSVLKPREAGAAPPGAMQGRVSGWRRLTHDVAAFDVDLERSDWVFGDGVDGTPLGVFAPLGHATFHPGLGKHVLCIAGGSGIAGMMSILQCAAEAGHFAGWDGHVFFGVRSERDRFYLDELEGLRTHYPARLAVTVALSDEDVPADLAAAYPGLAFARGLVHEVAGARMAGRFAGVRAYVAGPPPMVDASLRLLLREARLSPADIRYDKFS